MVVLRSVPRPIEDTSQITFANKVASINVVEYSKTITEQDTFEKQKKILFSKCSMMFALGVMEEMTSKPLDEVKTSRRLTASIFLYQGALKAL